MVSDSSIAQFAVAWCLPESLFATDRYAPLIGHSEVLVELLSVLVQTQRQQGAQSVVQRETGEGLAFILLQLPLETQQTHLLLCGLNKRRRSQIYDHKRNISASKHAEFTFQTNQRDCKCTSTFILHIVSLTLVANSFLALLYSSTALCNKDTRASSLCQMYTQDSGLIRSQ